jgi:hypothetical protein
MPSSAPRSCGSGSAEHDPHRAGLSRPFCQSIAPFQVGWFDAPAFGDLLDEGSPPLSPLRTHSAARPSRRQSDAMGTMRWYSSRLPKLDFTSEFVLDFLVSNSEALNALKIRVAFSIARRELGVCAALFHHFGRHPHHGAILVRPDPFTGPR